MAMDNAPQNWLSPVPHPGRSPRVRVVNPLRTDTKCCQILGLPLGPEVQPRAPTERPGCRSVLRKF